MRDPLCSDCALSSSRECSKHRDIIPPEWYAANAFLPPHPQTPFLFRLCDEDRKQLNRIEAAIAQIRDALVQFANRKVGG